MKIIAHNYKYRKGRVQEISSVVLFLLSEGSSFVTGVTIPIDGGEFLYHPLCPPIKPKPPKISKL